MLTRLLENWPYKLAAVVIAIALRGYVSAQMNPRTVVNVPVTVLHVPDGYERRDSTPTVRVQVTGSATVLDGLRQSDISATVDAYSARNGVNRNLPIAVSIIPELRNQIQIETKTPSTANVTLEQVGKSRHQLRVLFTRMPPPGYTYGVPVIVPANAEVSAATSVLDTVHELVVDVDADTTDALSTTPTPIDGRYEISACDEADHKIAGVSILPVTAHVTIPLIKVASVKTVPIAPMVVGKPSAPNVLIGAATEPALATISGPADVLDRTNVIMTAPVDITGATADMSRSVQLVPPMGIVINSTRTVSVSIRISAPHSSKPVPVDGVTGQ